MELSKKIPRGTPLHVGMYLKNSYTATSNPVGLQSILKNAAKLYQAGVIHGAHIFAGPFFTFQNHFFNATAWRKLNLVNDLRKSYFPLLGGGEILLLNGKGLPAPSVALTIKFHSGALVALKMTDQNGKTSFGGNVGLHRVSLGFTGFGRVVGNVTIVAGKKSSFTLHL